MSQYSEEKKFEIETIMEKRTDFTTCTTEYKVKWKGYNETEATWEPLENLIYDKAFYPLFIFERSEKAKKYEMNQDTEKFLKFFYEFDPTRNEIDIDLNIGNFKKRNTPERILKLEKNFKDNELYALIDWKEENGVKPMCSLVNTRLVAVFAHDLYFHFLQEIAVVQISGRQRKINRN